MIARKQDDAGLPKCRIQLVPQEIEDRLDLVAPQGGGVEDVAGDGHQPRVARMPALGILQGQFEIVEDLPFGCLFRRVDQGFSREMEVGQMDDVQHGVLPPKAAKFLTWGSGGKGGPLAARLADRQSASIGMAPANGDLDSNAVFGELVRNREAYSQAG